MVIVRAMSDATADATVRFTAASKPPTPFLWRLGIVAAVLSLGCSAYLLRDAIGTRGQAVAGVFCFFGLVADRKSVV